MSTTQLSGVLASLRRSAVLQNVVALTDGELLRRYVADRDQTAFEMLVQRHGPMVLGGCRRLVANSQDAEDVFQATFLVLVRKAATVQPGERVGNWLYGVAHHAAQKVRANNTRRQAREKQVRSLPEPATLADGFWRDLEPLLDRELSRLPEKYRLPIVLCDLEGRTRSEAARQLGWPEGTVAGRLACARKMLAKRLARHGLPVSAGVLAAVFSETRIQAAVPQLPVITTLRAANEGVVPAGVSSVAEGVMRTMLLSNLKHPVLVLVAVTIIAAGAALVIGRPQQADKPGGATGKPDALGVFGSPTPQKPTGGDQGKPDVVEETAWGEAVDGLQAGLSVNKHDFREGETASFTVKIRNVSAATITASHVSGVPGLARPSVTNAANAQLRVLMPPEPRFYRPTLSRSLKPGEVFELGMARLQVQAASGSGGVEVPTLRS